MMNLDFQTGIIEMTVLLFFQPQLAVTINVFGFPETMNESLPARDTHRKVHTTINPMSMINGVFNISPI